MVCLLTLQTSTLGVQKFDLVGELISDFIGCLRTIALREARRVGTQNVQETKTEATMVFTKICRKRLNIGTIC